MKSLLIQITWMSYEALYPKIYTALSLPITANVTAFLFKWMSYMIDILLTDLRYLIANLGKNGGLISPSVYDTAQVLRFYPPQQGVWPAVDWLLSQQQADGGWGNPTAPLARDVPTLASVLALYTYGNRMATRNAARAGLTFLQRQMGQWRQPLPDNLPVGVELLLPWLLDASVMPGLGLPQEPYATLVALGKHRRSLITRTQHSAGTTAAHSWEAWGTDPDPALIDASGGVGHSPAATAAWLHAAARRTDLADVREVARYYLLQAAAATGEDIPGVVPTVWPINRFEQTFVLYILLITGLLTHPQLQDLVRLQVSDLAHALRPRGFGMSDFFMPDGDDTAAGIAVLCATGHQVSHAILEHFENDGCFFAYSEELQPSLSVTARATHALAISGRKVARPQKFLVERQCPDGRWLADKWHSSWLYTTLHVVLALTHSGHIPGVKSAVDAVLAYQHADGGWGMHDKSTTAETVYGVLTLRTLRDGGFLVTQDVLDTLRKAYQWLLLNYRPFNPGEDKYWIAKELYRPSRIDRAFELSAMLALALEENSQ
ncbi:MAG: hypothetical protein JO235_00860 [Chroococcidiopsidaceae cyanobacterium CP_BM_RX_35]|nr:hypothetical protein [Chroococcidiopsidaceae cyanobacterium CP_BM_RX_35]